MSKIEWTGKTWNPVVGCKKISAGCANCYAERMAFRLAHMGQANYQRVVDSAGWNGDVALCTQRHFDNIPKRGMCFVGSMTDLFYEKVPDRYLDEVYSAMLTQYKTTFQILTKRPERALAYYQSWIADAEEYDGLPSPIVNAPNIWFGVSAENQEMADRRIDTLMQIPAIVRFVSAEPLLGQLVFRGPVCEWVILGCESGPRRRQCKMVWMRSVVEQCRTDGVPVFVKQVDIDGHVVKDPEAIAAHLGFDVEQIRQFPDTFTRTEAQR